MSQRRAPITPAAPAPQPRSARGERTRAAIVHAARTVFERDGFIGARTVDIPDEAGVARGSFYTYFRTKEDAFEAVLEQMTEDSLGPALTERREPEDPVASIRASHRAYLVAYRRNARLMAALEEAAIADERFRRVRLERAGVFASRNAKAIARWQERGLADPALEPLATAHALNAMVSRTAEMTYVFGQKAELADLVELLTRLWAGALGLPYRPAPDTTTTTED